MTSPLLYMVGEVRGAGGVRRVRGNQVKERSIQGPSPKRSSAGY